MFQSFPTKNGTGITIYGHHSDLEALYDTIHDIARPLDEGDVYRNGQNLLLLNLAYDVRKAFMGARLIRKEKHNGQEGQEEILFGFQTVWTDMLIFLAALRIHAGYIPLERLHQGMLFLLEDTVEKALFDYDAEGANQIRHYIGKGFDVRHDYAFMIFQALHIDFVLAKPGKKRFRSIPGLLISHFTPGLKVHDSLVATWEAKAKKIGCAVTELQFGDFPDIIW
ncbi:MAG: DUF6904 family protein [Flavisolibacter sp.]